jgi:hypothetical protein
VSGYFGRVLSLAGVATPPPAAPSAAGPQASALASPPLPGAGDDGFDPVAMGLEQESFVERPEAATPGAGRERPAPASPRGEPGAPRAVRREGSEPAPAAPVPAARPPTASTSAVAPGAPVGDRARPAPASPRPSPNAASDAPAALEHEVLVEAPATSAPAAAAAPARPADLLGQVRRWIATPPPARPAPGASTPHEASEPAIEHERLVATASPPASAGAARAAAAIATASPSAPPPRPALGSAAPPPPEPIDVHIGSIQVTVEDATPARARRTTPERSASARPGFGRGWLQRRLVRS